MTQIHKRGSLDSHLLQSNLMEDNRVRINKAIEAQFSDGCENIVVVLHSDTNAVTAKALIWEIQLAGWIVAAYQNDCRLTIRKY